MSSSKRQLRALCWVYTEEVETLEDFLRTVNAVEPETGIVIEVIERNNASELAAVREHLDDNYLVGDEGPPPGTTFHFGRLT